MTDDTYIDLENRLDFLLPEKRGYGADMRKLLRCAISTRDWVLGDAIENVVTELLQRMEAADRELREFDAWVSECEKRCKHEQHH
jgi:hypothetical protein